MPTLAESAWQRLTGLEPFPQPPLIRVRHPVVLMHGFGILAAIRRGGHLHDEAMSLRRHGVVAYAPNVAPYNPVSVRAEMWKGRLETILEETGAEKLNIIAHSMGGLDARYLIGRLGMRRVVASLVTISTPHHGTSLCDYIHEQPDRMREWAVQVFNWMGTAAMEEMSADVERAVDELTPGFVCETFNRDLPDDPGVRYWSFAGRAGKGTDVPINPVLKLLNGVVHAREGVNDGFVSVESATWGTFLGTIDADHMQQIGINVPGRRFDSNALYRSIAEMLAREGL